MKINLKDLVGRQRLSKGSLVIDCGGFRGDYTAEVLEQFGCFVMLFEPVPKFFDMCKARFEHDERVQLFPLALGEENTVMPMYMRDAGSSLFREWAESDVSIDVGVVKLSDYIVGRKVDAIKMNCEGGEYAILRDLHKNGLLAGIQEVLVQFHKIGNAPIVEARNTLAITHQQIYSFKWDLWVKRDVDSDIVISKQLFSKKVYDDREKLWLKIKSMHH